MPKTQLTHNFFAPLVVLLLYIDATAWARAPAVAALCQKFPQAAGCSSGQISCAFCHTSVEAPVRWNPYGLQLKEALGAVTGDAEFLQKLPASLDAIGMVDSDNDGATNQVELGAGTLPGDATSVPTGTATPCSAAQPGAAYNVCGYDARYALRKVMILACGHSPRKTDLVALSSRPAEEQLDEVVRVLNECLQSEHWRGPGGMLQQLAHPKVRPINLGADIGGLGEREQRVDYDLFVYAHIDGHDSRDLLRARYFVSREEVMGCSTYRQVDDIERQTIPKAQRVGMLTTKWFLTFNNMFTALPRTSAAQAYRAYLGLDIARNEGLVPVAAEPKDYDLKGVGAKQCAVCHSTLDPLSYPFSRYDGVSDLDSGLLGNYIPDRLSKYYETSTPGVSQMPQGGMVFGKPVATLAEWADVASNSDQFARSRVSDFWKMFLHRAPQPGEAASFQLLVDRFKTVHNYAVDPMLRDLVRLEVFGAP